MTVLKTFENSDLVAAVTEVLKQEHWQGWKCDMQKLLKTGEFCIQLHPTYFDNEEDGWVPADGEDIETVAQLMHEVLQQLNENTGETHNLHIVYLPDEAAPDGRNICFKLVEQPADNDIVLHRWTGEHINLFHTIMQGMKNTDQWKYGFRFYGTAIVSLFLNWDHPYTNNYATASSGTQRPVLTDKDREQAVGIILRLTVAFHAATGIQIRTQRIDDVDTGTMRYRLLLNNIR